MLAPAKLCWTLHVGTGQTMLDIACWNQPSHVGHGLLELAKLRWTLHVGTGLTMLDISCWNRPDYVGHGMLEPASLCWTLIRPTPKPGFARATSPKTGVARLTLVLGGCKMHPPKTRVCACNTWFNWGHADGETKVLAISLVSTFSTRCQNRGLRVQTLV